MKKQGAKDLNQIIILKTDYIEIIKLQRTENKKSQSF